MRRQSAPRESRLSTWERLHVALFRVVVTLLAPHAWRQDEESHLVPVFEDIVLHVRDRGPWFVTRAWVSEVLSLIKVRLKKSSKRQSTKPLRKKQPMMETLIQDVKYSLRTLRRTPAFTVVAILTLGLGVGANTAIFSVVNGVILQPLPYSAPDRLVRVFTDFGMDGFRQFWMSWPQYNMLREADNGFAELATYGHTRSANLSNVEVPSQIPFAAITSSLLPTLGVAPIVGRNFSDEEAAPNGPLVALLGYEVWQRNFAGRADVIGEIIELNGRPRQIVGVMPRGFRLPTEFTASEPAGLFLPLQLDPASQNGMGSHNYSVVGRLASSASVLVADQAAKDLARRVREDFNFPDAFSASAVSLHEQVVGDVDTALYVLLGTVGFVLLIACANVANLMLARAESRHQETALRVALGAGRERLVRQFLTESTLLALGGGLVAIGIAKWGVAALLAVDPTSVPRADAVSLSGPVLAFTGGLSILTGILFGLIPAIHMTQPNLQGALREGDRSATGSPSKHAVRRFLATSEVALALLLAIGAGLMLKSFGNIRSIDSGMNAQNVLTANAQLPSASYPTTEAISGFFDRVTERIRGLPGVQSVGLVSRLPIGSASYDWSFGIEGRQAEEGTMGPNADYSLANHEYFTAIGIPLLRGDGFGTMVRDSARPVVLINETMARTYWPEEDPIGERITLLGPPIFHEIIGIVADVRSRGLVTDPRPEMYLESRQSLLLGIGGGNLNVVTRSSTDPMLLIDGIRSAFRGVDPNIPAARIQTVESIVSQSVSQERFSTLLLSIFAGVALSLAGVGIYGVMSYSVAQRTSEIGIRMALGASGKSVRQLVVVQGMKMAVVGMAVGVVLAIVMTRLMDSLLYDVSATDPVIFVTVTVVLASVAFASNYLPALRASRGDPISALRNR